MGWKEERDLLIAQTMAFVQSVAGKVADTPVAADPARLTEPLSSTEPASFTEPASSTDSAKAEQRREVPSTVRSAMDQGDFRDEIRGRVAAFRAHQQLFIRDRDEYCNAMLAKARASTAHAGHLLDHPPIRR